MEEEQWFDISARRPDEAVNLCASDNDLPEPTETLTCSYRPIGKLAELEIKLVLKSFRDDSEQAAISSGLAAWEASDHLCEYLLAANVMKGWTSVRLIELGAGGLGKCGLLAHRLAHPTDERPERYLTECTILTDGDTNTLKLLGKNIVRNTRSNDSPILWCERLMWGREEAREFRSGQDFDGPFNIVLGSDLLYTNRQNIHPLFDTVDELLHDEIAEGGGNGKFYLAHNEAHGVLAKSVARAATGRNFFCEVLKKEGPIYVFCFRRPNPGTINGVVQRLQKQIGAMENEIGVLKTEKGYLQDRCRSLDQRCVSLRRDEDVPASVLRSFGEDNIAGVAAFLTPQCLARLALTSKHFGLKTHKVGTHPVSFMEKVAYNLYESASSSEREALPAYDGEDSPCFFYNELLELRRPLKFDLLFSRGIAHAARDGSRLVGTVHPIKRAPGTTATFTAACRHVMRAGRHYAMFSSLEGGNPLWFGIVRPLRKLELRTSVFNPLSSWHYRDLLELRAPEWGEGCVHCCVYTSRMGKCRWTDWNHDYRASDSDDDISEYNYDSLDDSVGTRTVSWDGMQPFVGGTIGMLLDYDKGTLTVFRNGIELGVMMSGLSGAYSWMVTVGERISPSSIGIKIERGNPPVGDSTAESRSDRTVKKKLRTE